MIILNQKDIDFKKISISKNNNKEIKKIEKNIWLYDILYNISYNPHEKVPLIIEFNKEQFYDHDIDF